jgi:hypothetical protein
MEIKAKTLNKIDELIGGPQGREGAVGIFQPKKPPENIMNKLSKECANKSRSALRSGPKNTPNTSMN